ncbi:hypothetical protein CK621_11340 [Vandammella animalimorsus]|uniref:DUF3106 domain-containing protein n=1 Tax=Vandammella animalimorsus TaxID=2029117 RepID=A0A2A2AWB1_9BURK|nr:hypothetical protein CK621_11340 [Vandammella animalimorsus]
MGAPVAIHICHTIRGLARAAHCPHCLPVPSSARPTFTAAAEARGRHWPTATLGFASLLLLALSWVGFQQPLLAPALPPGIVYAGPLILQGKPLPLPDLDTPAPTTADSASSGLHITRPIWADLPEEQQTLLAGLQPLWPFISSAEKRRWQAIARQAKSLDDDARQHLMRHIALWGALSEPQRHAIRQRYQHLNETELLRLAQAWRDYQQLSPEERLALLQQATQQPQAAKARPAATGHAVAARRNHNLVRIPAASQSGPGLSNLPKIPLQPVRFNRRSSPPAAAKPALSTVTTVQVDAAPTPAPPQAPPLSTPTVRYWHGIPITPPEPAPIYAN